MEEKIGVLANAARGHASRAVALVAHVMGDSRESRGGKAFEEVQETILALVAAVIAGDGVTTYQEFVFANLIAKDLNDPLRCRAFLNDYAERWKTIAEKTPGFVNAVVAHDVRYKTTICRELISELKEVVRCTAIVDGEDAESERKVAAGFIARADALFSAARWTVKWDEDGQPAIPLSSTINRGEFRDREIV